MYFIVEHLSNFFGMDHVKHVGIYTSSMKADFCTLLRPMKGYVPDLCDWDLTREELKLLG